MRLLLASEGTMPTMTKALSRPALGTVDPETTEIIPPEELPKPPEQPKEPGEPDEGPWKGPEAPPWERPGVPPAPDPQLPPEPTRDI
jgi:fused signal recognition particle receptor